MKSFHLITRLEIPILQGLDAKADRYFLCGYFGNMKKIQTIGIQGHKESSKVKHMFSIFECPLCGKHFKCADYIIKSNRQKSCGCYVYTQEYRSNKKYNRHPKKKYNFDYRDLYGVWNSMKSRCFNKKSISYKYYGFKGVSVCDEWRKSYLIFRSWCLENGWSIGLELDRINNEGNYSPDNCKFSTRSENSQNTRLIHKNNTTGYRCVFKHTGSNTYFSTIRNGKMVYLGSFKTAKEAAVAYNKYVVENNTLHPLNIIDQ